MKGVLRHIANRWLHVCARQMPGSTTLRPMLHRWRGVHVGRNVFIGDEVYIENEYPECVEIQDDVQISIRAILIAHTRGSGKLIIEQGAFIGPNSVLVCGASRTLRIGRGAVVGAGCVITKSVPAHLFVAPIAPKAVATVGVPLPLANSMEDFLAGLKPLRRGKSDDQ